MDRQGRLDRGVLTAFGYILLGSAILLGLFYYIVKGPWSTQIAQTEPIAPMLLMRWMRDGDTVEQRFTATAPRVSQIEQYVIINDVDAEGTVRFALYDGVDELFAADIPIRGMTAWSYITIDCSGVEVPTDRPLRMRFTYQGDPDVFALGYGSEIEVGRYTMDATDLDGLFENGTPVSGRLSYALTGYRLVEIAAPFTVATALLLLALCALGLVLARKKALGRPSFCLRVFAAIMRYRFLIQQLVARDFNTKYRRSFLGVLWSVMNPLLTMSVQFVVFSTLFRSNIAHYPVYLLTGIVLFGFFTDSVNLGMNSIVGSANLINKVYIPKYVFPVSRVLSSLINLLFSAVPLLLVMLFTGLRFSRAMLLIPFLLLLVTLFCIGMSFLLSAANVFFRDTSFLWSVVSLLWNFLTPIFYPETIIPARFLTIYRMNPMYQFVSFLRCITIDQMSPPPMTYVSCVFSALFVLLIGCFVFRRYQDRFILYL